MAYVKQVWQDRVTEYPFRRKLYPHGHDPEDGAEYADIVWAQGEVFAEGTPVTAERLNHMENGIFAKQDPINAQNKLPYAYIADTPTVLPNPCPLTFGSKTYDGTASVSLSPADIGLGTVFKLRGSKADVSGLPTSGNTVGDVWYVIAEHVGYVWLSDGTARWEQIGLPIDLSGYAKVGGTYPGMTVGHAECADSAESAEYADVTEYAAYADQLNSTVALTVSSPFVFRPAGGGADVEGYPGAEAEIAAVYGNTLVWNQLVDSDATEAVLKSGHVYLTRIGGADALVTGSGASVSVTGGTDNVFDLTRMFGADREPSSIPDFRALFPLPYYAYDAGRLLSFTGTGIRTVGFNALAPDGTAKLLGGNEYEIVGTYTALSYTTGETITPDDGIFTPSSNGVLTVTGADAETCVHLVWSGYRNGETADYREETKTLPVSTCFPDGMRSAGNARDELRKGKAIKRIRAAKISELTWTYSKSTGAHKFFFANADRMTAAQMNIVCADYEPYGGGRSSMSDFGDNAPDRAYGGAYTNNRILIRDDRFTSANAFVSAMGDTVLCYELAEPVETPIVPPLDMTFDSSDYGTEQLLPENTSVPATTPLHADIRYSQNLRDKLQRLPCSPKRAGLYFVRYDGVRQSYERLPDLPSESGSYVLKCTVGGQEHTFFWETEADTE